MATLPTNHSALLTTKEAAQYLGFQPTTLRNARSTGRLAGADGPPYRKMGTVVRYARADLDDWLDQFKVHTSTRKIW